MDLYMIMTQKIVACCRFTFPAMDTTFKEKREENEKTTENIKTPACTG